MILTLPELSNYIASNSVNITGDSKFHVGDKVYIVEPVLDYTSGFPKIIEMDSLMEAVITKVSLYKNTQNGELYFIYSTKDKEDMFLECQIFDNIGSAQLFNKEITNLGSMSYNYINNMKSKIKLFSHCEFERRN